MPCLHSLVLWLCAVKRRDPAHQNQEEEWEQDDRSPATCHSYHDAATVLFHVL
jgi:hypothetical protein